MMVLFKKCPILLGLVICLVNIDLSSQQPENKADKIYWYVYTGRHFDDMVTDPSEGGFSDTVVKPTLLFLYDQRCENDVDKLIRKSQRDLPYEQYIVVTKHHYGDITKETVWYQQDEKDNLFSRYVKDEKCLTILYWEAGSKLNNYVEIHYSLDVGGFVWHKFILPLTIQNDLDDEIVVKTQYDSSGKVIYGNVIATGRSSIMYPYISNLVLVFDKYEHFLYGKIHTQELSNEEEQQPETLVINNKLLEQFKSMHKSYIKDDKYVDHRPWSRMMIDNEKQQQAMVKHARTNIGRINGITFDYPTKLPRLSKEGYQVSKIADKTMQWLREFGKSKIKLANEVEDMSEPIINSDYAKSFSYDFSNSLQETAERDLKPKAEALVGTELKMKTNLMTAFHPGTFVRNHVNHRGDHVITAMLIIGEVEKDEKENNKPWPAEIVDFNGERKTIDVVPGEVIIYEAKTLIMGRRKMLEADSPYIVAYVHFTTVKSWPMAFVDTESPRYKEYVKQHMVDETDFRDRSVGGFANKEEL